MELHTIGIDLGKTMFHLIGLNLQRRSSRRSVMEQPFVRDASSLHGWG